MSRPVDVCRLCGMALELKRGGNLAPSRRNPRVCFSCDVYPFSEETHANGLHAVCYDGTPREVSIVRHHPSGKPNGTGYVVAAVNYHTIDGAPSAETWRYAREFCAAPAALALLAEFARLSERSADVDLRTLAAEARKVLNAARGVES